MKRITFLTKLTALLALWTIAALAFIPSEALGAVPQLINFQGILRDGSGNPVTNNNYSVRFRIYDDPTAGNVLWSESTSVSTNSGLFSVLLGALTPVPDTAFNNPNRWLGIKVGGDAEMVPRQKLTSVGYTFRTEQWTSAGQDLFRQNGNVGIGTATPGAKLEILGGDIRLGLTNGLEWDNGTEYVKRPGTDAITFGTESTERMTISATGNVGIGTAAPNAKLDVIGTSGSSTGVLATGGLFGVYGSSSSGNGVYGYSLSGYAGYFQGKVHVNGTLSKTAGGFKIDHPTDPANEYLYHSFVESPDMKNIYDGVVTIDAKGEAVVTLPDWFGALNKDYRYQLTAIGAPGPNLYIAEEVSGNRFKIAGGTAGMKVSWQVTGIRQDAYANAHRIPVEELKADKERGYYLHPDLFGQPEEKGTEWATHPEMMKERRLQAEQEKK